MAALLQKLRTRSTRTTAIGLDVGQSALRAAQLRREGPRWTVTTIGSCPRRSPERGGDEALFALRAARWLNQLGLQRRGAVVGLSPPDLELHALTVGQGDSAADDGTRGEAVRAELERLMTFDAESAEFDFWPLPESAALRDQVMGVAASSPVIERAIGLCDAAGLDCVQIDAAPCALARFGSLYRGLDGIDEDVWSVLDLGSRMSRIVVCAGTVPILARAFVYGGRAWTDKLANSLAVSHPTAERHKRDHGIAAPDAISPAGAAPAGGTLSDLIFSVLRTDLDEMIGELERSYRYVLQCFARRRPGPLLLVGGGAALGGLDALLQQRLGVPAYVPGRYEPQHTQLDLSACTRTSPTAAAEHACAIGLAIPPEAAHG